MCEKDLWRKGTIVIKSKYTTNFEKVKICAFFRKIFGNACIFSDD